METKTTTRGYFQSFVLGILGTIALGLTLTMDYYFGKSLALEGPTQIIMGTAFVGIEVIVVGLAAVNGSLLRDGHYWLGAVLAVFIVFGAGLAMTATIGFGGTERLGKSETIAAQIANDNATAEAENAAAKKQREDYMAWLKNTVVKGATRAIRRDANKQLRALINDPIELKSVTHAAPSSDIQTEVLVRTLTAIHVPVQFDQVQVFLILGVALFLTLSQSICFGLAAYRWPVRKVIAMPVSEVKPLQGMVSERDIAANNDDRPTPPRSASAAIVPIRTSTSESFDLDADQELLHDIEPDAAKAREIREQVADFLQDCTRPSLASRVSPTDFHNAYVAWAQRHDFEPLSRIRFGRVCATLGIARESKAGRSPWYINLALIPGTEEVALQDAA
jgi:hypothetical protein